MIRRLLGLAFVALAAAIAVIVSAVGFTATTSGAASIALLEESNRSSTVSAGRIMCGSEGVDALLAANAARAAGFPDDVLVTAVAVAGAESGYDPRAGNQLADGRTHQGLWQISSLHTELIDKHGGDRYEPASNARMALELWEAAGRTWQPWEAYTNGAHLKYVEVAEAAVRGTADAPVCARPAGAQNDLGDQPRTAHLRALIQQHYGPLEIGGKRASSIGDGHKEGRALDVMTYTDRQLGWRIVAFCQINAEALGIEYIIFEQAIWHPGGSTWRKMENRGSITANHYDHPHIEVLPG